MCWSSHAQSEANIVRILTWYVLAYNDDNCYCSCECILQQLDNKYQLAYNFHNFERLGCRPSDDKPSLYKYAAICATISSLIINLWTNKYADGTCIDSLRSIADLLLWRHLKVDYPWLISQTSAVARQTVICEWISAACTWIMLQINSLFQWLLDDTLATGPSK